jgi:uncharacterized protein (DUF362 family)/Pyruvate/2-oxoacid:ferredoxin oxidoreductase delta subunit
VIGDSPGGKNTGRSYRRLLRKTGIQQVIDETGCESVFFDADVIEIFSETPRTFRKFPVPRILTEVDRVICLPKLKTHTLTGMTGAVKLLYGYLPGVTKAEYHFSCGNDHARFAELLADLSVAFPPELSIMDAVMGMEGDGPQGGEPRKIGLVMAGTSCPALDMAAAAVMGFEPGEVLPLENLIARGACPRSPDEIAIHGERIRDVTVPDLKKPQSGTFLNLPPLLLRIAQGFLSAAPSIETSACIRCGTCAEDCPAGAIAWSKGEHPRIRYRSCIRCFCCQELCPEGAVSVRIPLLRRLIG